MPAYHRLLVLLSGAAVLASGSALAQTASPLKPRVVLEEVTSSKPLRDGVEIQAGPAKLRITALRDDIIRVRIGPAGALPEDASWAVLQAPRGQTVDVQPIDDTSSVGFRTTTLDVRVEPRPLRIVIRDLAGNLISADAAGRQKPSTARSTATQSGLNSARAWALTRPGGNRWS